MQVVRSFYRFSPLTDNSERCLRLQAACQKLGVLGTILLAEEGINASLSGLPDALDALLELLAADVEIGPISYRETGASRANPPFSNLKVRVKSAVLKFQTPVRQQGATHVAPEDWNDLIGRPDVQVVDVRNNYESKIGTFADARVADIDEFGDFPEYARAHLDPARTPNLALYCTGGIRCEKAGSWLYDQGFASLYQLTGGILGYLERVPAEESRWRGDCFVFDRRVAVTDALKPAAYELCSDCQMPVAAEEAHSCQST